MDRATENLIIRLFGSASLAFLLVHGGQDLGLRPAPWAFVTLWVVVAIAGNWALARLNAKRAALWTTLVVLGLAPALMPVLHLGEMGRYDARYMGVLYATCTAGLLTTGMATRMLSARSVEASVSPLTNDA
jgi:hypothetical protein